MRRLFGTMVAAVLLAGGAAFALLTLRPSSGGSGPVGADPERFVVAIAGPRRSPFTFTIGPSRQLAAPGQTVSYRIRFRRRAGFRNAIRLRVSGLPAGVRAAWSPARARRSGRRVTLRLRVAVDARPTSARLVVTGRSRSRGRRVSRSAVVVLGIAEPLPFRIGGDLSARLYPGSSFPLDLSFANPHDFAIRVTRLTVTVRGETSSVGCSGTEDFAVTQYAGPYPLTLPPGDSSLAELVPDRGLWPRVAMLDLPRSQDACKRTRITLDYDGTAVR